METCVFYIVIYLNLWYISNNWLRCGYIVYVASPYSYKLEDTKIYVYQYVKEDEMSLYGFKNKEEKELFLKLIGVKGLGCKMALPMLSSGNPNSIIAAIESGDIAYLKKFPKIGDKVARQIILDLKGKLVSNESSAVDNSELVEALKALGYKASDINKILSKIDNTKNLEGQIKEALKLLLK